MSELINNSSTRRTELKSLIKRLHEGDSFEAVRADFEAKFSGVSAREIADMEQELVKEGLPPEEIQKLCDVHASLFDGSVMDIHKDDDFAPGHPLHTIKLENRAILELIENEIAIGLEKYQISEDDTDKEALCKSMEKLMSIDRHYARKEMLVFPLMEKHGITAPPQVMWGVDDEIRGNIKTSVRLLKDSLSSVVEVSKAINEAIRGVKEMISKEEDIMIPMISEVFTAEDFAQIHEGTEEIGYCLIDGAKPYNMGQLIEGYSNINSSSVERKDEILMDAGSLTPEEINAILNTVPFDMTYVAADNRVKYFTQGKERIFDRPKTILGREVKNCHPPKSVHVVEKIVEQLMAGEKDHEDFWIKLGERFVHIRYFAVRSSEGKYLGTLEVTQDIKPLLELEGEKRLMS